MQMEVEFMLGLLDQRVLELMREDLASVVKFRFGKVEESVRASIGRMDDFDRLEWLIDRAETEETLADFLKKMSVPWKEESSSQAKDGE